MALQAVSVIWISKEEMFYMFQIESCSKSLIYLCDYTQELVSAVEEDHHLMGASKLEALRN